MASSSQMPRDLDAIVIALNEHKSDIEAQCASTKDKAVYALLTNDGSWQGFSRSFIDVDAFNEGTHTIAVPFRYDPSMGSDYIGKQITLWRDSQAP